MSDNKILSSRAAVWSGRVLSGLVVAFLAFDATVKLIAPASMFQTADLLGWPPTMLKPLGVVLLASTLLYAAPPTAVLGAILLTGYLGGAVATHMRFESPLFTHILFGVYLGVLVWGGLFLRQPQLRPLLPLQRERAAA